MSMRLSTVEIKDLDAGNCGIWASCRTDVEDLIVCQSYGDLDDGLVCRCFGDVLGLFVMPWSFE